MTLRLLLFGPPGSGKSALLGALAQVSSSQAAVLRGKVVDESGQLAGLHQATYGNALHATGDEVLPYPIRFQVEGKAPIAATLVDSSGRLAEPYLAEKAVLVPGAGDLARELLAADTIILTLDAAAASQAEPQLAMFREFLARLQEARSGRTDIADLPVYLVLTKCDQLARPEDSLSQWLQRIEEAKRRLGERFACFLKVRSGGPAFGSIALHLWATAIRRPSLIDRPAPSAEPYGVAELFRQCFAAAEGFDRRERRAGRRLEFAVAGLGLLLAVMGLIAALFVVTQPNTEVVDLGQRVQAALPERDESGRRLLRGDLQHRLDELRIIEQHPAFADLPGATRAEVESAADEIASHVRTKELFKEQVRPPYQAKNEGEFDRFEKQAEAFTLPDEYAAAWHDTSLARQLAKVRAEFASVRSAVIEEVQWIRKQAAEGAELNAEGNRLPPELASLDAEKKKLGRQHAEAWFAAYLKYTNRSSLRLPGDQPLKGTAAFTYADLRKFQAVRDARKEWEQVKGDLDKTYKYVSMFVAR
jgi:hypothetical protein